MNLFVLLMAMASAKFDCSLAQAVQRARDSAFSTLTAMQRMDEETLNRKETFAHLLPKLELDGVQLSQSSNIATFGLPFPGDQYVPFYSIQDIRISTKIPLVHPALWRHLAESDAAYAARTQERETAKAFAGLQGGLAWIEAAKAQALVKDREEGLHLAQTLREMSLEQKQAGTATRLDLVRAQIQETQSKRSLSMARMALEKALLVLNRLLSLEDGDRATLVGALPLKPTETLPSRSGIELPQIRSAKAARDAARLATKTAQADKYPTLSGFADYGYTGTHLNRDGLWTGKIGIQASWELFDGGGVETKVSKALVRERIAALAERDAQLVARQDEQEALSAVTETAEQLRQAMEAGALVDTELVLAKDKFRAGASGNAEVVQAQGNQTQAHAAWIEAAGTHQAALLRLRWARGNWEGF